MTPPAVPAPKALDDARARGFDEGWAQAAEARNRGRSEPARSAAPPPPRAAAPARPDPKTARIANARTALVGLGFDAPTVDAIMGKMDPADLWGLEDPAEARTVIDATFTAPASVAHWEKALGRPLGRAAAPAPTGKAAVASPGLDTTVSKTRPPRAAAAARPTPAPPHPTGLSAETRTALALTHSGRQTLARLEAEAAKPKAAIEPDTRALMATTWSGKQALARLDAQAGGGPTIDAAERRRLLELSHAGRRRLVCERISAGGREPTGQVQLAPDEVQMIALHEEGRRALRALNYPV